MILVELQIAALTNYVYNDILNLFVPILIFAGISIGNILGMAERLRRFGLDEVLFGAFVFSAVGFAGLTLFRGTGLLWLALPMVGYGAFLARLYSEVPLRTIVLALGASGAPIYLILNPARAILGPHMTLVALAMLLLASVFWSGSRLRKANLSIGLVTLFFLSVSNLTLPKSSIEARYGIFKGAQRVVEPFISPLVRTDLLYLPATKQTVMIMNGSRWAVIPSKSSVRKHLTDEAKFFPSYDMPYLFRKPKKVLVIGSAEGRNVLAALRAGAEEVVAVDVNPAVFEILKGPMAKRTLNFMSDPRVRTVVSEGRHFLETTDEKFDLITLQGVQTASSSASLNTAVLESFLFTAEAIQVLWRRLTDDGVIFFDEYRSSDHTGQDSSVLRAVGLTARQELALEDFSAHHVFYSYLQSKNNPRSAELTRLDPERSTTREVREGLILSRQPLDRSARGAATLVAGQSGEDEITPEELKPIIGKIETLSDNRPFFIQNASWISQNHLLLATLAFCLLLSLGGIYIKRNLPSHGITFGLFLLGAAYVQLIMALLGPTTLLLGDPNYTAPVLFTALYGFSLVGGLMALRLRTDSTRLYLGLVILVLFISPLVIELIKPHLLSSSWFLVNVIVISLIVGAIAIITEIPYVLLLRMREGRARGWAFTAENLGTFAGVPLGLLLQVQFGFAGALAGAVICYSIAFTQVRSASI